MKFMDRTAASSPPAVQPLYARPAPKPAARGTLSQRGAMALARELEAYLYKRQFPAARFWAEAVGERFAKIGTYEIYRVTCNLVNGLPPSYRDEPCK